MIILKKSKWIDTIGKLITIDDVIISSNYLSINTFSYISNIRFLKTKYNDNKKRFLDRFLDIYQIILQMEDVTEWESVIKFYSETWDKVQMFSYEEAFKIDDDNF